MSEWLREIYEGRKNPSKDEFDTDYEETIRKQVHEKKLTKPRAMMRFTTRTNVFILKWKICLVMPTVF